MLGNGSSGSSKSANADSKDSLANKKQTAKDKATQRRMQGVSCDACKFRKVKCDRRAKVEKKLAEAEAAGEATGEDPDVSCSVCTSHGLRCTFTQAEPKKRRGRRIVEIQAHQRRESSNLPHLPSATDGAALGGAGAGSGEGDDDAAGSSRHRHMSSYPSPMSTPSTPLGLFSIPGLTRSLLDACILAYFRYCSPTVSILHADVFAARYAKYFELYTGTRASNATTDPALASLPPLTELLILAVACAGAGLLLPPITGSNPRAKFKLQQRLSQRCHEILRHVSWTQRLREEGADLVEAVYVLVDPTFPMVNDDPEDDRGPASSLLGVSPDPLRVQPTSHEALVRLTFSLSIHRRPKAELGDETSGPRWRTGAGELIDDREVFRRVRVFWNVFLQDSFRSFGARRTPLISEDQYDQDLPRWAPRQDGDFSASFGLPPQHSDAAAEYAPNAFFSPQARAPVPGAGSAGDPSPASAGPQPARFSRYDALWLEAILRLCFITRTVGTRSVSPRAQGRGVLTSDMEHAMSAFAAWHAQLPAELAWETQVGDAMPLSGEFTPRAELNSIAFRNSLKSVFLEVLFHGQILGCWAAVKDYGLRTDAEVNETTNLLAAQLGIHNSPHSTDRRSSSVDGDAGPSTNALAHLTQPPAPPEVELRVRSRLEGMVTSSFLRVALISRQAAAFGIPRASRAVLRDVPCSYAMWGCGLAADMLQNRHAPRSGLPVSFEQVLEAVASLTEAVESVDSVADTPAMVRGLQGMIAKFPGGKELLSRHKRDTTGSSTNEARSAAASGSQASSTPSPSGEHGSREHSGRTDVCNPYGFFGSPYGASQTPPLVNPTFGGAAAPPQPPRRMDDIAALSSNADALYDASNGFGASELLDAQWLEQLAAVPLPASNNQTSASSSGLGTHAGSMSAPTTSSVAQMPFHGGQTDSYRLQNGGALPAAAFGGAAGDARDYAANAWEMPFDDRAQPALPQQGAMDWLWGGAPNGAAH